MDRRYPIGPFQAPEAATPVMRAKAIQEIAAVPAGVRAATEGLNDVPRRRLDGAAGCSPYR